jgi:hypothetical protein
MLAVPADRLPAALADLDPGNRALLDLSLRRGVSDAEIGELLRKDPADVARGRDAVLGLLADALDLEGHDRRERVRRAVAELTDEAWRAGATSDTRARERAAEPTIERGPAATEREPEVRAVERPPASAERGPDEPRAATGAERERDEPRAAAGAEREPGEDVREPDEPARERDEFFFIAPETRRGRRGRWIALVGLVAVVVALIALLAGGDDGGEEPAPKPEGRAEPGEPPAESREASLAALAGGRGSGTVAVAEDGSVEISVRGLPRTHGTYEAWLYDSVVDAVSLGTFDGRTDTIRARLPARAVGYRFIDVSLEPRDGNPNHSGDSVLRGRLASLLDR